MNPLILKAVALVSILLAVFAGGYKTGSAFMERQWLLDTVEKEKELAAKELSAQGVSSAYELRLRDLENAARSRPTRIVRLCNEQVPVSNTPSESDGSAAGGVSRAPGPDIGSGLTDLATDADKCAAQLSALQEWIKTVAISK